MLLLDEPTNHIDLDGLEMIDAIMDSFEGVIVLASHDRTLLKKLRPTSVLLFANQSISMVDDLESYIKKTEADVSHAITLLGRF